MKNIALSLLVMLAVAHFGFADEASFHHVSVPNLKGKQIKAALTFSDRDKAIEIRPAKGDSISISYGQIDKCSYEYTSELTIGFTQAKNHWLEIDYHDQDAHKVIMLQMDKHEYIRILDALKIHTGIDAEVLGNAKKR